MAIDRSIDCSDASNKLVSRIRWDKKPVPSLSVLSVPSPCLRVESSSCLCVESSSCLCVESSSCLCDAAAEVASLALVLKISGLELELIPRLELEGSLYALNN